MRFASLDRPETIDRLARETYDLVVIGGGITGAGCALDAASRGLKVALIERRDVANGTSSKSSKMVHGGLRYLQEGDVRLVYEALAERQRAIKNAPHLVREMDFMIPIAGSSRKFKRMVSAALWAYDLTGGFRIGKLHKKIGAEEARAQMPTIPADRLAGGFYYPDARTDDARLTMYIARTAALHHNADIATYVEADGLDKDMNGRVRAVACHDLITGRRFSIDAEFVVNASGVWTDTIRRIDEGSDPHTIRQAKGIHIVIPWEKVQAVRAMGLSTGDGRPFFVMPWGTRAYIGTTDTDYDGSPDDPQANRADIDYLLEATNKWVTEPVEHSDIIATWAGVRPLVRAADSKRTSDLSRKHKLIPGSAGFVTITGGKLTTYRLMAEDTIDYVIERSTLPRQRSLTKRLPLDGARDFADIVANPRAFRIDTDPDTTEHLLHRHGSNAAAVVELTRHDPSLAERLVADLPYLRAEVVHAVRAENAQTVADVLERRLRVSLEDASRGLDALDDVTTLMSAELGWDAAQAEREKAAYRARVSDTFRAEAVTTHAGGGR